MLDQYYEKPRLVISSCLALQPVRYNGEWVKNTIVLNLIQHVEIISVCPEISIGLGVPRDRVILYKKEDAWGMSQPKTGLELTERMNNFSDAFIRNLGEVDGFLLKSRSPSCGIANALVYADPAGTQVYGKGTGLFASAIIKAFSYLPIEDEGRLHNPDLRDLYFSNIFALARWRKVKRTADSIQVLRDFHASCKYLFMARSPNLLKMMGQVLANCGSGRAALADTITQYEELYKSILKQKSTRGKNINAMMHILGHLSKFLKASEKQHFFELLEKYRKGRVSIQVPREILKSWAYRFDSDYLRNQFFLSPYPGQLESLGEV